jgi:DNA-binding transcriptional LysR family regulator
LDAFAAVARTGSFSKAARELHITQPALSMRMKQLEDQLGVQLIRRSRTGLTLTPAGSRILEYVTFRQVVDAEVLRDLGIGGSKELSGIVRIAGHYSAIVHRVVPALASFLRKNPAVQLSTLIREDDQVPLLLENGECDFALVQRPLQNDTYQTHALKSERYVLVRSSRYRERDNVLIDSDFSDVVTQDFFSQQPQHKRVTSYRRSFLHNETSIARAVSFGLGRAVLAEAEIEATPGIVRVPGLKPLLLPCFLQCSRHIDRSFLLSGVKKVLLGNQ